MDEQRSLLDGDVVVAKKAPPDAAPKRRWLVVGAVGCAALVIGAGVALVRQRHRLYQADQGRHGILHL